MIFDCVGNAWQYLNLSENFKAALEFLLRTDLNSLSVGDISIHGREVYAFVKDTKLDQENHRWEAHSRYADIQVVLEGAEAIWYHPFTHQEIESPYDALKDVMFYREMKPGICCTLYPKDFIILLPNELHRPDCPVSPGKVTKKLVIKVLVDPHGSRPT